MCVRTQRASCPPCLLLSALVLATIHLMFIHSVTENPGPVDSVSVLNPGASEGVDGKKKTLMFYHPSNIHDTISQSDLGILHFSKVLH